jgi:predicted nucleic-acid-binding protein
MIGADTNVLVRLLVSDDLEQQRLVLERLERVQKDGGRVLVSSVVLAELSWVLSSAYGYDKSAIMKAIEAMTATPSFLLPDHAAAVQALEWYGEGPADFADYLILALAISQGGSSLLTFDRKLLKHRLCAPLV